MRLHEILANRAGGGGMGDDVAHAHPFKHVFWGIGRHGDLMCKLYPENTSFLSSWPAEFVSLFVCSTGITRLGNRSNVYSFPGAARSISGHHLRISGRRLGFSQCTL